MKKFTLRFDDTEESLHEEMALVADHLGVSINTLAKDLIGRQLRSYSAIVEQDLEATLSALHRLTDEDIDQSYVAFAEAEGQYPEPIQARMVEDDESRRSTPSSVAEVFGR
jgi:hypothetical protein